MEPADLPPLPDLDATEELAFVALVRYLIEADGEISNSELYDLVEVGVVLGQDRFAQALDLTEDSAHDLAKSLAWATKVTRPDVRKGMFGILEMVAEGDGVHIAETTFLEDLRLAWELGVTDPG